jgi:hypothetical protein
MQDILIVLLLFLLCVKNRVCLSYDVHVSYTIWWAVMRIVAGVGDLMQRTVIVKYRLGT